MFYVFLTLLYIGPWINKKKDQNWRFKYYDQNVLYIWAKFFSRKILCGWFFNESFSHHILCLGLYNDAIIAANMALEISPSFVVSHFTMANIYTSKNDLEKAKLFYLVSKLFKHPRNFFNIFSNILIFQSTLTLQSTFEPALDRLLSVMCGKWNKKW